MTSRITYLGDLRTECQHISSGQTIITDAPVDNNGKGEAFSPTDLTATSLGTCMMTIMCISARNHDIELKGTIVEITKHMDTNPRKIKQIDAKVIFPNINYEGRQKEILEKAALTCPVALSLHPDLVQNIEFIWA